jgi:hypothetical protein
MGLAGNPSPLAPRVFAAYCRSVLPNRNSPGKTLLASKSFLADSLQGHQKHLASCQRAVEWQDGRTGISNAHQTPSKCPAKCPAFCQA